MMIAPHFSSFPSFMGDSSRRGSPLSVKEREMCCDQKGKRDKLQICMKNKCLEILHQKVIQGPGSKKKM